MGCLYLVGLSLSGWFVSFLLVCLFLALARTGSGTQKTCFDTSWFVSVLRRHAQEAARKRHAFTRVGLSLSRAGTRRKRHAKETCFYTNWFVSFFLVCLCLAPARAKTGTQKIFFYTSWFVSFWLGCLFLVDSSLSRAGTRRKRHAKDVFLHELVCLFLAREKRCTRERQPNSCKKMSNPLFSDTCFVDTHRHTFFYTSYNFFSQIGLFAN